MQPTPERRAVYARDRAEWVRAHAASAGWDRFDTAFVVAALIATCIVHPVHFMLSHPFWLDESWVAVLTRAPWSRLVRLSSSSPAGFVALLKLVPGSGLQRGRLLVLAFNALSVALAYALARLLEWPSNLLARFAGAVAALVVMLAPLSLLRNDLKQYTCDAFCALLVLAVGAAAERSGTRKMLVGFGVAALVVSPFSSTAAFVSVAMFGGLFVSALATRNRRRVIEIAVVGVVTAIGLGAYYGAAVVPNLNPKLKAYWAGSYLSGSPLHIVHVSWTRLAHLDTNLGMPAIVFVALFLVGIVVLVRLHAYALAFALPFLWVEMVVVARLQKYPFLDLRTSHFLLVASLVLVAIGGVGIVSAIAQLRIPRAKFAGAGLALIVTIALAAGFTAGFARFLDGLHIADENVRAETVAVSKMLHPHDTIVVNQAANFGFSYYWPHGHVRFFTADTGQGFRVEVAGVPAIYASGRNYVSVLSALRTGVRRWHTEGRGARLFIVRTHMSAGDVDAWHHAFLELHLRPRRIAVGVDPLLVLGPA